MLCGLPSFFDVREATALNELKKALVCSPKPSGNGGGGRTQAVRRSAVVVVMSSVLDWLLSVSKINVGIYIGLARVPIVRRAPTYDWINMRAEGKEEEEEDEDGHSAAAAAATTASA